MRIIDILVIGSGPAGCTAAIYAARAGFTVVMILGNQAGGQLTITTDVENYPGFSSIIQGPWLMKEMQAQAAHVGAELMWDHITSVEKNDKLFMCKGESESLYQAKSIIISTGAEARWLGLESEKKFQGYGVSGCATCDGVFYKKQDVLVVGGGNTAVEEALYLTNHANKVYLLHRRDVLRAEQILQNRLFSNPKVEVIWNHTLSKVEGDEEPKRVTGAVLTSTIDNTEKHLKVSGIFIAIGHVPNTKIFKDLINMDEEGYIITNDKSTSTNIPGIYAAGDVQDKIYRQAITAAGTGCMAALEATKFLKDLPPSTTH